MDKKIIKFLEENACKSKQETLTRLNKKFELTNKEAEETYTTWKKEYMKFKG